MPGRPLRHKRGVIVCFSGGPLALVAPFTVAHILAFPELGYVHKKFDVFMYEFPSAYDNIKTYKGFDDLNLYTTLWIGFKDIPPPKPVLDVVQYYPFGPGDKIIREIERGDVKATLFMGGSYVERARVTYAILRQYLKHKFDAQEESPLK